MSTNIPIADERLPVRTIFAPALRVAFSWTLTGNVIYAGTQFGILSALAKLGSPAVVGQYALALAISAPIFLLTNLQLRGVQATDALSTFTFGDYLCVRCYGTFLGLVAVVIIVALLHYDRHVCLIVFFVALAKSVESMADVISGFLQKLERLDQVAIALILRGTVSLLAVLLTFYLTRSVILAVIALTISWLAVIVAYDFRVMLSHRAGNEPLTSGLATTKRLIWLSLPMGIVSCLFSLRVSIPRFAIERVAGSHDLGIFASIAYLVTAIDLIMNSLGQSAAPRLSRMFVSNDLRAFRRLLRGFVSCGFTILLIGVPCALLFGRSVLTVLYTPEYARWSYLLVAMVGISAINTAASFMSYGLTAAREFRVQVPIVGASTLAVAIGSFLLIPRFGLYGAAGALLASVLIQLIATLFALKRAVGCQLRSMGLADG
jgi:O-antigen/teichoic acid export membrane protein